jgi:hypothetical protein
VSTSAALSEATVALALSSVIVRVEVAPARSVAGVKDLATRRRGAGDGERARRHGVGHVRVPVMLAASLVYAPPIAEVTSTRTWQLATAALIARRSR